MRWLILIVLLVTSVSCSERAELDGKTISSIESEAREFLNKYPESKFNIDYSNKITMVSLQPEKVYITEDGIYIVLTSSFISESGLYVPRNGIVVDTSVGQDPSYELLKNNVYRFNIKG